MIVAGNLPFDFVENPFFAAVLRMARSTVLILYRQKVRSLLDKQYEKLQTALFTDLSPHTKVLLALDYWTLPNKLLFLGIIANYINMDWKYYEFFIGFEQVTGSHTGEHQAHIIKGVLSKLNILHCLFAITADNASNNGTMRHSLQGMLRNNTISWNANAMRTNYVAHIFHLTAKELLHGLKFVMKLKLGNKEGARSVE
jgi:hypothetical protein